MRVDVGRGRLVLPAAAFGPPDNVVVVRLAIAEGGLLHRVFAHERQAPNDGIYGATIDGAADQLADLLPFFGVFNGMRV